MYDASAEWVATHKERLLPETFVELTYLVSEPGLHADFGQLQTAVVLDLCNHAA